MRPASIRTSVPGRAIPALLLLAGLLFGPPLAGQEVAPDIPHPRPEQMSEGVREQVVAARRRLEELARADAPSRDDLAEAYGALGKLYHTYLFPAAAAASYAEARRLAPDSLPWTYYSAVLAQQERDLEAAAELYAQVLRLSPAYVPALLRLARVEIERGAGDAQSLARAEALLRQVLEQAPASAAARAGLARIAQEGGDLQAAADRYREALEIQPQADLLRYQLGLVLRDLGKREEARAELARAGRRDAAFADPLVDELVPESVGSLLGRGGRALARGDRQAAITAFRGALEEAPDNLTARENLASVLLAEGEAEEAVQLYREVVQLSPERPVAYLNLARALLGEGGGNSAAPGTAEAVGHLRQALVLAPGYGQAHLTLARALAAAGSHAEAEPHFAKAAEITAENAVEHAEILLAWGRTLAALERLDEARQNLEKGVSLLLAREEASEPGEGSTESGLLAAALLDLATLRQRAGDFAGALAALDQVDEATDEGFTRALAHFNAANLLLARGGAGDAEAALARYDRALAAEPVFKDAHYNRATALLGLGRLEEALAGFEKVGELAPEDPEAHRARATVLARLGRHAESLRALEAGLATAPGNPSLQLALARLLAASPEAGLRDPARALSLAESLHRAKPHPLHAEALAMALAATGRFEEADRLQSQVLTSARQAGAPPAILSNMEENQRRYENQQEALYRP